MALTGRAVWLVLLGVPVTAFVGSGWAALGWLGVVVAVIALDLAVAASPRQVRVERELPGRVRLGEGVDARLLVTNVGRRGIRGLVRDGWQPSAGAERTRWRCAIPTGERRAFETRLVPFRRGERRTAHVTVRSVGPLGVAARQATVAAPGHVRVLPPFASRRHLPSRLARLRELDGRTSVMVRGQGTEFDSIREYVRGDDVRSIDWRATARRRDPVHGTQQLMVRTWRPERDRRVVLVVDSGRTGAARIGDETRLDTAFESTLLLAALADRAGDRVDLVVHDRRTRARVQGASGGELLQRMVDAMAPVEPELLETDWASVPALVRQVTSQRALVVLCTALDSPGQARALLAALPQLTQRHTVVVAAPIDGELHRMAADRGDREAVYRAAAAERALLDAGRVADAARRLGAEVVTAAPLDLPPALADRYLALKAAGRL